MRLITLEIGHLHGKEFHSLNISNEGFKVGRNKKDSVEVIIGYDLEVGDAIPTV